MINSKPPVKVEDMRKYVASDMIDLLNLQIEIKPLEEKYGKMMHVSIDDHRMVGWEKARKRVRSVYLEDEISDEVALPFAREVARLILKDLPL